MSKFCVEGAYELTTVQARMRRQSLVVVCLNRPVDSPRNFSKFLDLNVGRRILSLLHTNSVFLHFLGGLKWLTRVYERINSFEDTHFPPFFQLRVRVAHSTTQMFKHIMSWEATIQGNRIITCQSVTTYLVRKIWQESELVTKFNWFTFHMLHYLWTIPLCPVWTIGFK